MRKKDAKNLLNFFKNVSFILPKSLSALEDFVSAHEDSIIFPEELKPESSKDVRRQLWGDHSLEYFADFPVDRIKKLTNLKEISIEEIFSVADGLKEYLLLKDAENSLRFKDITFKLAFCFELGQIELEFRMFLGKKQIGFVSFYFSKKEFEFSRIIIDDEFKGSGLWLLLFLERLIAVSRFGNPTLTFNLDDAGENLYKRFLGFSTERMSFNSFLPHVSKALKKRNVNLKL